MDETGSLEPQVNPEDAIPDQDAQAPIASASAPTDNLTPIPLTPEQIQEWWDRITKSRTRRLNLESKWEILYKEYLPTVTTGAEDVKAGMHFRNVHTKKSKLFFRNPDLILTPEGPLKDAALDPLTGIPMTGEQAAYVKQAILNKKLGRKGVNTKRLMGECLFDILAWTGLGCTKIGYRNVTKPVQEPVMQPDPNFQPLPPPPGSMLGLQPDQPPPQIPVLDPMTGQPQMKTTMVPIFEEWYWTRFSPKKLLLPDDLNSMRFDEEASWMGMEFFLPESVCRASFNIPDEVTLAPSTEADDRVYKHDDASSAVNPKTMIHGVEIVYKAAIFDGANEKHPQALRQLVLIENDKEKVYVHRPSPDQTFDELGVLTPDSMVGFPFHIFFIRDMADSPFPWADTAFTNSSVKHINTHRRQSVKLRDANIGKFLYDSAAFTPDEISRLQRGDVGEWIAVLDGRLAQGVDKILAPVIKNEPARDDWRIAQGLKQDVEEMLGIGGTNAGATEDTVRTATEISTSAAALAERLEDERDLLMDIYLDGVEKFDSLLQRYADDTDYIQWVGQDGTRRLSAWNRHTIAGKWAYSAKPDSQLKIDVARDRAQTLQYLQIMAPYMAFMNIKPLLKKVANQFGLDPNEAILPDLPMSLAGAMPPPGGPGQPPGPPGPPGPGGPPPITGGLPNAPAPGAGTPEIERKKEVGR